MFVLEGTLLEDRGSKFNKRLDSYYRPKLAQIEDFKLNLMVIKTKIDFSIELRKPSIFKFFYFFKSEEHLKLA